MEDPLSALTLRPVDRTVLARTRVVRATGLAVACGLLLAAVAASLTVGARAVPLGAIADAFAGYDPALEEHLIIRTVRVPRTVLGLLVGAGMGAAGAVMQGVARNPLADPGILGVNAGAALFVVFGIFWFGMTSLFAYVWLGLLGAALASAVVYLVGSRGRSGATPVKLTLAGAAVAVLISSLTGLVLLTDRVTNEAFRFWSVGSLAGRGLEVSAQVAPFVLVGAGLALASGRLLNAISLGDDVARGLGQRVGRARLLAAASIVLLCGAGTAAAGPIAFVGLVVAQAARSITGPDHRWLIPYALVLGATLVLVADVLARVVAAPAELPAGLVTALLGGPIFVLLARRRGLVEL